MCVIYNYNRHSELFFPIDKYSILDGISMLGYVCVLFLSQIIYTVMFFMKRIVAKYISVVVILLYAIDFINHFPYRGTLFLVIAIFHLVIFFMICNTVFLKYSK